MIYSDPEKKRFELHTKGSCYIMEVDQEDRLNFVAWGKRFPSQEGPIHQKHLAPQLIKWMSHETFKHNDEISAWGDESLGESGIDIMIPHREHDPKREAPHFPVRDLRLRYKKFKLDQPDSPYAGHPTHGRPVEEDGGDWLIITLGDLNYDLVVELHLRPRFEYDILERFITVRNQGNQTITLRKLSCALNFPRGTWQATSFSGAWGAEFTRNHHPLTQGITSFENQTLATGLGGQPSVILQKVGQANRINGETFGTQLAWSGNWRIACQTRHDRSLKVVLGEHPHDSEIQLPPGEHRSTPLVISGRSEEGEEGLRRSFQAYHLHCTMPKLPNEMDPRPVLYNSWEATYFKLSIEGQIELARRAAAMGVELFVVDDGWFGGRRSDHAGLGDWHVSPDVFPNGLTPLIEEVHQLGMKFGIWFEPEMVNADSDLYREHPDWILHYPGAPRLEGRNQLILDFGNPEVVANIRQQMESFLDHHSVDFIKWDMNRAPNAAGSMAGQNIWRAHVEAVYGLMDGLLKKYPNLIIQSCASGGGRIDPGIFSRCSQAWTSDNTDALSRVGIQDGFATFYPPAAMECWVTHSKNHMTQRILPLRLRFAIAMRGVLGIGSSIDKLEDGELKRYQHFITFYKQVRHLVHGGKLHRACLPEINEGLSVWQFTSDDGLEAYINAIVFEHRISSQLPQYTLKDLCPDKEYLVTNDSGKECFRATGAELMCIGLGGNDNGNTLACDPGDSWHYHLQAL